MMTHIAAAPFGPRRLTPAQVKAQATAQACPEEARAGKWRILKAVTEARTVLGISDRAAAVLGALLSFHPEEEIAPGTIVFPSNRVLSLRAHGMAAPTLRRHIAALVEAGLVIRRDSPNGKRYARKDDDGAIALAFGFELTPLVARLKEIETAAARLKAEARDCAVLRERVTILRRDVVKAAGLAGELDPGFDAAAFLGAQGRLLAGSTRALTGEGLAALAYDLGLVVAELDKRLAGHVFSQETSASDAHRERHIQNSNHSIPDSEPLIERERAATAAQDSDTASPARPDATAGGSGAGRAEPRIDLPAVLAACPDLKDWCPGPVRSWMDLQRAAEQVRPALGISSDAWAEAVDAMGGSGAAVTMVTILQRAGRIASPGGYLRALSAKARAGTFSPAPVVVSLLRQRVKAEQAGAASVVRVQRGG